MKLLIALSKNFLSMLATFLDSSGTLAMRSCRAFLRGPLSKPGWFARLAVFRVSPKMLPPNTDAVFVIEAPVFFLLAGAAFFVLTWRLAFWSTSSKSSPV